MKSFKSGTAIDVLSQKHSCTNSTIIRNLKKNLGEAIYKELFNKNKSLKGKFHKNKNQTSDLLETNFENEDLKKDFNDPKFLNENITDSNFAKRFFFEIALDWDG